MSSKLTVFLSKFAEVIPHVDPNSGAVYLAIYTPRNVTEDKAAAWLGYIYLHGGMGDYTWEPEVVVIPPDATPINKKYKMKREINVRISASATARDIGDIFANQIITVEIIPEDLLASTSGYFWAKLIDIDNPSATQRNMLSQNPERWVALKNNNELWVTEV